MYKKLSVLLLGLLLILAGCTSNSEPSGASGIDNETLSSIRQHVEDNLSSEYEVDNISVTNADGKFNVSAQLHGGISGIDFEPFTKEVVAATKTASVKYEVEFNRIQVTTKGSSDEMISWGTTDGENGTLVDTRNPGYNGTCYIDELYNTLTGS